MKQPLVLSVLLAALTSSPAAIVQFDLSPPGTSPGEGLNPANENPPTTSTGSGNEIFTGISYDTESNLLAFAMGYGSFAGFDDLTGPATGLHIHGPAITISNAPVLFNLAPAHLPAAPDPAKGGVIVGTATLTEEQETNLLAGLYYVNIHTAQNPGGEIRGQLIPLLNVPPMIACPEPAMVECASRRGTPVTVSVNVSDANGDALTVVWKVDGRRYQTNMVPAGGPPTEAQVALNGVFGAGVHQVEVSVTDGNSDPVVCNTTVTVQDTTPPVIHAIRATPPVLWPPNHRMVPVTVWVRASDECSRVTCRIVSVTSNESRDGRGDGKTSRDWRIISPRIVLLRAERSGHGDGRVYTVTVECTDASGNKTRGTVNVKVPHDHGKNGKNGRGDDRDDDRGRGKGD